MTVTAFNEFVMRWFVPFFAVLWLVVTALLAFASGWVSLARRFRARENIVGQRFRFRSGRLGRKISSVRYGSCLFITVNEAGFRLSVFFMFRFLSPPIFIPWEQVESVEERRLLLVDCYVIHIRDHWSQILLWGDAGRALKEQFDAFSAGRGAYMPSNSRERASRP